MPAATLSEMTPKRTAKAPIPTAHATRLPRSRRKASRVGPPRSPRRGAPASRDPSSAAPTSRRSEMAPAAARRRPVAASGSRSTRGRAPVKARSSSDQPRGVAQRIQWRVPEVSPATRRRRASTMTPAEISLATRRDPAIWRGQGADAHEDQPHRDDREREVGRAGHGQAAGEQPGEGREPDGGGAGADRDEGREIGPAPADDAREHELLPAGVLLAAKGARGGQEPPDRREDRQHAPDAPGGVALRGEQVVGRRRRTAARPCPRRTTGRSAAGRRPTGTCGGRRPAARRRRPGRSGRRRWS